MYKTDLYKQFPAISEAIEPAYAHMLGVMGMRYLAAKKEYEESGDLCILIDVAINLWGIIETINLQTILLQTCTHASIAIMNHSQKVARMLEDDLGVKLFRDATGEKKLEVVGLADNSYRNWRETVIPHLQKLAEEKAKEKETATAKTA